MHAGIGGNTNKEGDLYSRHPLMQLAHAGTGLDTADDT